LKNYPVTHKHNPIRVRTQFAVVLQSVPATVHIQFATGPLNKGHQYWNFSTRVAVQAASTAIATMSASLAGCSRASGTAPPSLDADETANPPDDVGDGAAGTYVLVTDEIDVVGDEASVLVATASTLRHVMYE
jgi:hypothetical protein